jgi:hypothetical protein
MRYEVLAVVIMSVLVFWVVMPCRLVCRYNISEEHTTFIFRGSTEDEKMKAACFSEMLISVYKFTRHYYPEDEHQHLI